ncbi:ATP-dependent Clp protease ATP-binding subunit [Fructilactobacillus fructivorans]|uniref:ATP-dependent Clp protease ATP-binding subunit ClpA n=1 Tax=Fructilactobacillus fructivorans TaxID=1614 RepID=A0A0C1LXB4_9LACO|nr:ATP-dependent Clp protease ATP-binding subunit [Fructilactobacillus fructivorans]KID41330.1 ATP-dependent Clp protease ATP-binding subunit ClpA [Fructilactobacillus fructivorans]MCT0151783.1 ATP-dependent Clp protease ATP-binding subunit [Fructilactobacillus fructivorans]MCT2867089.1 ATP-dependent Clp protease ATP-binding subunit [Fructilactobacillus fructivorans]MCT2868351.1 ATP-dependent Clp protease ATP-binding subunit [Fructilactobacillus fructivorans]MCT2873059.1 ATP-dependent Clp prot
MEGQGSYGFGSLDDFLRAMQNGQVNDYQVPPQSGQGNGRNGSKSILSTYGTDLTKKAKAGKLDPVIGRDKETARAIEVLNRRGKNNPVLIGEAGVGKTAIVEGLAQKIADGTVPQKLQNKQVIQLDMVSMVQGTGVRGQFEKRMQQLIKEVQSNRNVILFIDEIHEIMGAGNAEGGMDAGNVLKPALARGDFQLIGATTMKEYRDIEKDSALSRRLQPIMVKEPTVDQSIKILKGLQNRYENYHLVKYTDKAVKAAATLSDRYISDRYLPDKAIDLLDETGSRKNLTLNIIDPKTIDKEIDSAEHEKEVALDKEDYEQAAYYRDKIKRLHQSKDKGATSEKHNTVTEKDMQQVVEEMTNIPVGELQTKEQQQLKDLAPNLKQHVIGQDKAVDSVAKAIKRNRIGFNGSGRPIGSFLFVGSTGIGKTEMAKQLARELFGSEDSMIRFDMSEYREPQSVAKLIGSPPGYVGYDEAGQLTEKVRRNPYSLILLDEVEKAHPDVLHTFLQILDDGRLTDSQGRTVSFKDTVIIMTSNAGSDAEASVGFTPESTGKTHSVMDKLGLYFKPEFLNRFDDIVEFNQLTKNDLNQIVDLMIKDMNNMLSSRNVHIAVTDSAKQKIVELGYNPSMGARPLRRVIQEQLEDQTADYFLNHPETNNLVADTDKDNNIIINAK